MAILGAGTAGMMMAHKMRKKLSLKEWQIDIFDKSQLHYYQPAYIFIPFGAYGHVDSTNNAKPMHKLLPKHVNLISEDIMEVDKTKKQIVTNAAKYDYDWLILATGTEIAPSEIEGMTEGYRENVFYFYTLDSALDLQTKLKDFKKGKLVIEIADFPIKCPVAPIEFAALADSYFRKKGIRKDIDIEVVTNQDSLFSKPIAGKFLNDIFQRKGINITTNFPISQVESSKGKIESYTGQSIDYDLLVAIPPNVASDFIDNSGLSDGSGFAATHQKTMKSLKDDYTYALGDCTNLPTSKAGSVAHFEANIVEANLLNEIAGKSPVENFDGHALCFIELGKSKASLIDFNYDHQPVEGKFPHPALGPFSLLKENRLNHWGKLFFRYYYWNILIPDRAAKFMELFVPTHMNVKGKNYPT